MTGDDAGAEPRRGPIDFQKLLAEAVVPDFEAGRRLRHAQRLQERLNGRDRGNCYREYRGEWRWRG